MKHLELKVIAILAVGLVMGLVIVSTIITRIQEFEREAAYTKVECTAIHANR